MSSSNNVQGLASIKDSSLELTEKDTGHDSSKESKFSARERSEAPPKKRKKNTIEEKRKMRGRRKKERRRKKMEQQKKHKEAVQDSLSKVGTYRRMAHSFWERWQWELMKRRDSVESSKSSVGSLPTKTAHAYPPEIDPIQLTDPVVDGRFTEVYVGQGSFSVVRLQLYRGIKVAVKEFQPKSACDDVKNEAAILASLTHPYLPLLFGICTRSHPYRIIIQFHGINSETITLHRELREHTLGVTGPMAWLIICMQLLQAVEHVHNRESLHNDIKSDNILITSAPYGSTVGKSIAGPSTESQDKVHIVLIDFGKATPVSASRRYNLSEAEKVDYMVKFPHIAPELVGGKNKQSIYSDMYSVGKVFQKLEDNHCFKMLPKDAKEKLICIINQLNCKDWHNRPCSQKALEMICEL